MANMNQFVKQAQAQVEIPSEWILCVNEDKAYPSEIVADGCTAVIGATNRSPRERAVAYITGRHEVKRVTIDPSVGSEDREMLEDLIAAAVNDAVHRIESASQAKMQAAMGGMSLPPGMKLPF